MSPLFAISLGLAWAMALVEGLVLMALHAGAGRLLFEQSSRYKALITEDGPPLDTSLPAIRGRDARTHEPVAADRFRGQPLVVLFVSPDCATCEELLQAVQTRQLGWEEKINYLIAVQAGEVEAAAYARGLPNVAVVADPGAQISQSCRVERVPFGLLVNAWGYVRMKGVVNTLEQLSGLIAGQGQPIAGLTWVPLAEAEAAPTGGPLDVASGDR